MHGVVKAWSQGDNVEHHHMNCERFRSIANTIIETRAERAAFIKHGMTCDPCGEWALERAAQAGPIPLTRIIENEIGVLEDMQDPEFRAIVEPYRPRCRVVREESS